MGFTYGDVKMGAASIQPALGILSDYDNHF